MQLQRIEDFKRICGIIDEETSGTSLPYEQFGKSTIVNHHRSADDKETTETPNAFEQQGLQVIEQPKYMKGGVLKEYQTEALEWLLQIHQYGETYRKEYDDLDHQINAILADEMGLGKTITTLALLCAVYEQYGIRGKHLIVVPKSTISQWEAEQQKWCPFFRMLVIVGEREERERAMDLAKEPNFDFILTTYDVLRIEYKRFQRLHFQYMVLDEGHKLKSQDTQICQVIKDIRSTHKLLLTGTPIQNDLNELWSLLNVLMPALFSSAEEFVAVLSQEQNVVKLQQILKIFILRREKKDVENLPPKYEYLLHCPMTQLQKRLYKGVLMRDVMALREAVQSKNADVGRQSLSNILMQLRKVTDHPYLMRAVEPEPYVDGDHLIYVSGKMVVLQKLIEKIRSRGERTLVFCQMTKMLNIIEDYLCYKQISYVRIDGSTELEDRAQNMKRFASSSSDISVFLLSTRAGSLGLNLTAANHVIIYQQDFNPQVDVQAVGRAYRILQKKPVYVYRLQAENTVDERIYERALVKMKLDDLIMKSADYSGQSKKVDAKNSKNSLMDLIAFGSDQLFNDLKEDEATIKYDYNTPEVAFSDEKLDQLLEVAFEQQKKVDETVEKQTEKAKEVIQNLTIEGKLETMDVAGMYRFEGEDFKLLTERLAEERRSQFKERIKAYQESSSEEEQTIDKRDIPSIQKFKRSIYYRPDYYLLNEKFYLLQQKVFDEIQKIIEPIFITNQQMSYKQYLEDTRAGSRKDIYVNENLPGLTEKQVTDYMSYLEVNCPLLDCKVVSKKDFAQLVTSLTDQDNDEKDIDNGYRRLVYDFEQDKPIDNFTTDPELQNQYSCGLLPASQRYQIAPAKQFELLKEPDYSIAYKVFKKESQLDVSEEVFTNYSKTLLQYCTGSEFAMKIIRAIQKRNNGIKIYQAAYQLCQVKDPLKNIVLPIAVSKQSQFSEQNDRFLIVWVQIFGLKQFKQCKDFIQKSLHFRHDVLFKAKDPSELRERVERQLKAAIKKEESRLGLLEIEHE